MNPPDYEGPGVAVHSPRNQPWHLGKGNCLLEGQRLEEVGKAAAENHGQARSPRQTLAQKSGRRHLLRADRAQGPGRRRR
jgi:hypothetical protein